MKVVALLILFGGISTIPYNVDGENFFQALINVFSQQVVAADNGGVSVGGRRSLRVVYHEGETCCLKQWWIAEYHSCPGCCSAKCCCACCDDTDVVYPAYRGGKCCHKTWCIRNCCPSDTCYWHSKCCCSCCDDTEETAVIMTPVQHQQQLAHNNEPTPMQLPPRMRMDRSSSIGIAGGPDAGMRVNQQQGARPPALAGAYDYPQASSSGMRSGQPNTAAFQAGALSLVVFIFCLSDVFGGISDAVVNGPTRRLERQYGKDRLEQLVAIFDSMKNENELVPFTTLVNTPDLLIFSDEEKAMLAKKYSRKNNGLLGYRDLLRIIADLARANYQEIRKSLNTCGGGKGNEECGSGNGECGRKCSGAGGEDTTSLVDQSWNKMCAITDRILLGPEAIDDRAVEKFIGTAGKMIQAKKRV